MTYKEFIEDIRDIADYLENSVKNSQVIKLSDEFSGEDDTLLMDFEMLVEEFLNNATGKYGHAIVREKP